MIIDGKALSAKIKEDLKIEVENLNSKGIYPSLAVVLVGNDPASEVYVRNKAIGCEKVGIKSYTYKLPENSSTEEVLELLDTLNKDSKISGILVQAPLPKGIDSEKVFEYISPNKDVDGFTRASSGDLYLGKKDGFLPCTAFGVIELIKSAGVEIAGKTAVVVGRSTIVGKPTAHLLMDENATVTICHSKTPNIKEVCKRADILVVAIGRKHFITKDMVKEGAVVIDVGINRVDGKLYGDVDFENVKDIASYITPVPGGVGPMTIAELLRNTVKAAIKQGKA